MAAALLDEKEPTLTNFAKVVRSLEQQLLEYLFVEARGHTHAYGGVGPAGRPSMRANQASNRAVVS